MAKERWPQAFAAPDNKPRILSARLVVRSDCSWKQSPFVFSSLSYATHKS
jgi:hypothetical protein